MSKIGKKPINIPEGIQVTLDQGEVVIAHKSMKVIILLLKGVDAILENNTIAFTIKKNTKQARTNWGTLRALVANAIEGFTHGFQKTLILDGIGFRITKEGSDLVLNIGFSHPVRYTPPAGVSCEIEKNTLTIKGNDKAQVGQVAAELRALKKPEPYKGTGFRYRDEIIKKKAGKKAGATTA